MIQIKNKDLFIDGIPAREIGALVQKHSQAKVMRLNEWAYCRICRTDHPLREMVQPVKENRQGYIGICKAKAVSSRFSEAA